MISETRKKAVKSFNRRLKKATGLEKQYLLSFAQQSGITQSGYLSTKAIVSTNTIKAVTKRKIKTATYKQEYKRKLSVREKVERELQFKERHGLQYSKEYQKAADLLEKENVTDEELKKFTKHKKIGSDEYIRELNESRIEMLKYYAYQEENKDNTNAKDFIKELEKGVKNNYTESELNNYLNEIIKKDETLIQQYEQELQLFKNRVILTR